jgi:hypothetical protein
MKRIEITLADKISSEGVGANAAEDIAKESKRRVEEKETKLRKVRSEQRHRRHLLSAHLSLRPSPVS